MSSKPISSGLAETPSFAARLFSFANKKRLKNWAWLSLILLLFVAFVFIEVQTSLLQSWFFTRTNEQLSYQLATGRRAEIAFPRSAPFDDRRGYSKMAAFQSRLETQGYQVTQQAQQSEKMVNLIQARHLSPLFGTARNRSRYPWR